MIWHTGHGTYTVYGNKKSNNHKLITDIDVNDINTLLYRQTEHNNCTIL